MKTFLNKQDINVSGEVIFINGTYYVLENSGDYSNATGELLTFLNARNLREKAEIEYHARVEKLKERLIAKGTANCISALQMARAANTQGRLVALRTAIAALPETNDLRVSWDYRAEDIKREDLNALVPGTLTSVQADALFNAARNQ